jgi:phage-related protein (TIGR01555 family)
MSEAAAKPKSFARATKDSFVNFMARVGLGAGSQQDASHYRFGFQSRNRIQMEAAYRSNWVAGMAVDTVAEDMTRAGTEITSEIDPADQSAIEQAFNRLAIWPALRDTVRWSRLYGGALAVVLVDGQSMASPLNIERIGAGQFRGLLVLDRWLVQPSLQDLVTDYGPDLGLPRYYDVVADSMALSRQRIHYTRCIRLDGLHLPYWQRRSENLWGQSVLERLWDRMIAFDSTTEGAAQLVYKAHLRTFKVEGLRDIIATGGPALDGLTKQIEMMRQTQSNEGMTLMDGTDEFDSHQYTFSGLSDMLLQFGQQLSGALQIPLVRLFGQSPAGLSATGESDLRTYYDNINAQQNSRLRAGLHMLYEITARSETGHGLDDDFDFAFRSLWQMSETDKAAVVNNIGTTINTLEQSGTISHAVALRELRGLAATTGVFSSISDEDIEEAENEPPTILPEPPEGAAEQPGQAEQPYAGANA